MLKMSTIGQNACFVQTFVKVVDGFVGRCLLHFYNVNKHVGYDMTSTVT